MVVVVSMHEGNPDDYWDTGGTEGGVPEDVPRRSGLTQSSG